MKHVYAILLGGMILACIVGIGLLIGWEGLLSIVVGGSLALIAWALGTALIEVLWGRK